MNELAKAILPAVIDAFQDPAVKAEYEEWRKHRGEQQEARRKLRAGAGGDAPGERFLGASAHSKPGRTAC